MDGDEVDESKDDVFSTIGESDITDCMECTSFLKENILKRKSKIIISIKKMEYQYTQSYNRAIFTVFSY